jgi:aryl-phospho-beta-D-glucosidase BglC (GH1 family)
MSMGAAKSKILSNYQKLVVADDTNFINENTFNLVKNPITTIVPPNSLSRVLGVQITMSANSKLTRPHVKKSVEAN